MLERTSFNLRSIFPNLAPRLASQIKQAVRQSELPMVNAGASSDVHVLLASGARTGIFFDLKDKSGAMVDKIRSDQDIFFLKAEGRNPREICFRHEGEFFRIEYFTSDIKNLPVLLGNQRIAFYYSAVEGGPDIIPNAAFNALIKGGYMASPFRLGDPKTCAKVTGMAPVARLSRGQAADLPVEAVLYKKTRSVDRVQAPGLPGIEVFYYLRKMLKP